MKRQRARYQMKEQDKTSEKQLNEMEIDKIYEIMEKIIEYQAVKAVIS